MIRTYVSLTKPGIIMGNALTAAGGFFLASQGSVDYILFFAMLIGLSLIIAAGCIVNNYIDRDIDALMTRTKHRALVTKQVPLQTAIWYALTLGMLGALTLALLTNLLTLAIALLGFFVYVVLYGIMKRRSSSGALIGSISGAVPPVVGYTAVTNQFDLGALLLFLILVFWQMPHFYAIALYRLEDYTAAKIPVLPTKKGVFITKIHMLLFLLAFISVALSLTYFGFTGYLYFIVIALLSAIWLGLALKGFGAKNTKQWARRMFFFSLIVITTFSLLLTVNKI